MIKHFSSANGCIRFESYKMVATILSPKRKINRQWTFTEKITLNDILLNQYYIM